MEQAIGLVAALPQEIRPLLARFSNSRREMLGRFTLYRLTTAPAEILLVETGMGPKNAAEASRLLVDAASPSLLVSFGFAGALAPQFRPGDVVLANRILFHRDRLFSQQPGLTEALAAKVAVILESEAALTAGSIYRGTFITTEQTLSKKEMAARMPKDTANPVVEMETSAVARVAASEKIPLIGLRVVSDPAEEELLFSLQEICNSRMRISIPRIVMTMAKKPNIIPQLARLGLYSRKAGENLALAVSAVIAAAPELISCSPSLKAQVR